MISSLDEQFMARALVLAKHGLNSCDPNPRVGCVLVKDGNIIGEGWHQRAGAAHAEINALQNAQSAGNEVAGATAYVTLEPCSHQGRTPPCAQALVKAGISRVVGAMTDPNPLVSGNGYKYLKQRGVTTDFPCLEGPAQDLNPGFIKRMQQKLPYVRCKLAMGLDGRTAMASGESQWITGAAAREDVQKLRACSSAIISGIDTVLMDGARLNVRGQGVDQRQPLRVILDSQLRLGAQAPLLSEHSPIWLVSDCDATALAQANIQHPALQLKSYPNAEGQTDLLHLLQALAAEGCNEVLVEAGATLAGAFLQAGVLDELVVYVAPTLMGNAARGLFNLPGLEKMSQRYHLQWQDVRMVGDDIRITAKLKQQ